MPRYQVEVIRKAEKALDAIDKTARQRLVAAIEKLATDPRPAGAVAYQELPGTLRIRVGDYRIIYSVNDGRLLILVILVDHRKQSYRT